MLSVLTTYTFVPPLMSLPLRPHENQGGDSLQPAYIREEQAAPRPVPTRTRGQRASSALHGTHGTCRTHIPLSQGYVGAAVTSSAAGDEPQHGAWSNATKGPLSSQSHGL